MKRLGLILLGFCASHCGMGAGLASGRVETAAVLAVEPAAESLLSDPFAPIAVTFDREMAADTVTEASFIVAEGLWRADAFADLGDIAAARERGDLVALSGILRASGDLRSWSWTPTYPYTAHFAYTAILTPKIQGAGREPLSADPARGSHPYLFSFYAASGPGFGISGDPESPGGGEEEGAEESGDAVPSFTALVLSEVYYDAIGDESDGQVFVELLGEPAGADLSGVQIVLVNGADGKIEETIALPEGTRLSESGYCVVADLRTGSTTETQVAHADVLLHFDPQNGPDSVQLLEASGAWRDGLGYGEGLVAKAENGYPSAEGAAASDVAAGESLCRRDAVDRDDNARDFAACVPTPGAANQPIASETAEGEEGAGAGDVLAPSDTPRVFFSEVATDPQQDWNDSSGGDAVPFDALPGNGTVGTSDEWVELYNASDAVLDLSNWTLEMADNTPVEEVLGEAEERVYFAPEGEGRIASFAPGDFLILGNPTGDMQNAVTLSLSDETGTVIDRWTVEDGNATGINDETRSRVLEEGEWVESSGAATPFGF